MATEIIAEELTCPVCLEFYKDPRLLPCHHSFCKSCLVDLHYNKENDSNRELQCPSCRYVFQANDEMHIESLPKNFTLASIVGRFQESLKVDKDLPCDVCDEGQKGKAIKKCLQCHFNYCRMCLEQLHPRRGALANHTLVHIFDAYGEKHEHEESRSASLSSVSKNQYVAGQIHDQLKKLRYCMSCDEICNEGIQTSEEGNHEHHNMTEMQTAFRKKREELECTLGKLLDEDRVLEKGLADVTSLIKTIHKRLEEKKVELVKRFGELAEEVERRKMSAENRIEEEMKMRITSLEGRLLELKDLKARTKIKIAAFSELSSLTECDASIFLMKLKELQNGIGPVTEDYIKQVMLVTESLSIEPLMNAIIANAMQDVGRSERRLQIPAVMDISPKRVNMSIEVTNVQKAGTMSADVKWSATNQAGQYEVSYSCNPDETIVLKEIADNRCRLTNLRWESSYTLKVTTQTIDGKMVFDKQSFKTDPEVNCFPMAIAEICNEKIDVLDSLDEFTASDRMWKDVSYIEKEEFYGIVLTPVLTKERLFWTMNMELTVFEKECDGETFLEFGITDYSDLDEYASLSVSDEAYSCSISKKSRKKFHLQFHARSCLQDRSYPLPQKLFQKEHFSYGFLYDRSSTELAIMDCQSQEVLHVFDVHFGKEHNVVFAICPFHTELKMCLKTKLDYIHCTKEDISYWIRKINLFKSRDLFLS